MTLVKLRSSTEEVETQSGLRIYLSRWVFDELITWFPSYTSEPGWCLVKVKEKPTSTFINVLNEPPWSTKSNFFNLVKTLNSYKVKVQKTKTGR